MLLGDIKKALGRDSNSFRNAAELARAAGMRWHAAPWPGFRKGEGHAADTANELCHELAHYLVSPKWLLRYAYFGLGEPGLGCYRRLRTTVKQRRELERQASALGIALLFECGAPMEAVRATWIDHGWGDLFAEDVDTLDELQYKRLWNKRRKKLWDRLKYGD